MARPVSLEPTKVIINNKKRWRVNVGESISEDGKKHRPIFATLREAKNFSNELKKKNKRYGQQAIQLPVEEAVHAKKAIELLKGHDENLLQVVNEWLNWRKYEEKSITLRDACENALKLRKNKRENTKKDFVILSKKLPTTLLNTLVINLTKENCEKALNKITKGIDTFNRYRRVLNAVMNDAIKDGYAKENPVTNIRTKDKPKKEVRILEIAELRRVFSLCKDFRGRTTNSPDARDAGVAFAFLAFAGLRPDEFNRLDWKEVQADERKNISVKTSVSKNEYRRHVPINKTLLAFIKTVPIEKRVGKVAPTNWKRKKSAVMVEAGLEGQQDIFRHSYGSYLEPLVDEKTLIQNMGHTHISTYLRHYKNARTKKEAKEYFAINLKEWTHRKKVD